MCRDLDDENEDLRRANFFAVTTKLHESGVEREPTTSELETFEQLYNHACHLIACKRLEEAAKVLKLAEASCVATLKEDGCSEKEIQDELKPIRFQNKYIKHQLSRAEVRTYLKKSLFYQLIFFRKRQLMEIRRNARRRFDCPKTLIQMSSPILSDGYQKQNAQPIKRKSTRSTETETWDAELKAHHRLMRIKCELSKVFKKINKSLHLLLYDSSL